MKNTNHNLTPVEEAIRYFDPYPHPVLRMMAEDYESRQRKKNKFGGGTSNRKDPEYEEQEDINGYNYVGKGDMRGLYQVPNSSEYRGYWTADGHPIGIDWGTGYLVDEVTGDIGIMNLPEITVTGTEKPHTYATSMSANLPLGPTIFNPNGVQESTLGQKAKAVEDVSRGMRVLSPAAWMDTAYDAMYTPDEINFPWMEDNQGLGDPFLDILFDAGVYGGLGKATRLLNTADEFEVTYPSILNSEYTNPKLLPVPIVKSLPMKSGYYTNGLKNFQRSPWDKPSIQLRPLNNDNAFDRLVTDLEEMTDRTYIDNEGVIRVSAGILPEDMANYSKTYKNFYNRRSPEELEILRQTHIYPSTLKRTLASRIRDESVYDAVSRNITLNPNDVLQLGPSNAFSNRSVSRMSIGDIAAHEDGHALLNRLSKYKELFTKYKEPKDGAKLLGIDYDKVMNDIKKISDPQERKNLIKVLNYLTKNGAEESILRGLQGKNIKNITTFKNVRTLKNALYEEATKSLDNRISTLIGMIDKYGDWETTRQTFNKYSPMIVGTTAIGATQVIQSKEK